MPLSSQYGVPIFPLSLLQVTSPFSTQEAQIVCNPHFQLFLSSLIFSSPALLPPPDSDEEDLGPELTDRMGNIYNDLYAPGCINKWSWKYHSDKDPFGSLYN
jgi:hypothetical protein